METSSIGGEVIKSVLVGSLLEVLERCEIQIRSRRMREKSAHYVLDRDHPGNRRIPEPLPPGRDLSIERLPLTTALHVHRHLGCQMWR